MLAVKIFFWILEFMFFAGIIGSAIVVILTSIDDAKEIGGDKREMESSPAVSMRPETVKG